MMLLTDASTPVVAAWIAAAAAIVTTMMNLLLARSFDEDRAISAAAAMLELRLRAYTKLWPLLDVGPEPEAGTGETWPVADASPKPAEQFEDIYRDPAGRRQELREWYYDEDGSGLLLSHDAQALWSCVERGLAKTTEANPANRQAVWASMSLLRTELKRDLDVRGSQSYASRLRQRLRRRSTQEREQKLRRAQLRSDAEAWCGVPPGGWPTDTRGR
jgi:hypothetical protein